MIRRTSITRQDHPSPAMQYGDVEVRAQSGDLIPSDHLEQLERLDDAVFGALGGDASALEESAWLYPKVADATPSDLIDESRSQYIRQAEKIVQDYHKAPSDNLVRTFAALEILLLVAD